MTSKWDTWPHGHIMWLFSSLFFFFDFLWISSSILQLPCFSSCCDLLCLCILLLHFASYGRLCLSYLSVGLNLSYLSVGLIKETPNRPFSWTPWKWKVVEMCRRVWSVSNQINASSGARVITTTTDWFWTYIYIYIQWCACVPLCHTFSTPF